MNYFVIERSDGKVILPTLEVGESIGCRRNVAPADIAGFYAAQVGSTTLAALRADPDNLEVPGGFGANELWGVGWDTYTVENTNDSGAGSLRAGLESATPYVIECPADTYIDLQTGIKPKAYKLINGNGCALRVAEGGSGELLRFEAGQGAHHIWTRQLRLRGRETEKVAALITILNSLSGQGDVYSLLFDHLSLSWVGNTNLVSINNENYGLIYGVTFTRCIFAMPLAQHPTGFNATGNHASEGWRKTTDLLLHANAFIHSNHRNPLVTTGGAVVSNNVIYNAGTSGGANTGGVTRAGKADFINNYIKRGPRSSASRFQYQWFESQADDAGIYSAGNYDPDADINEDQWDMWDMSDIEAGGSVDPLGEQYKRTTPISLPTYAPTLLTAADAYTDVLADVGCNVNGLDSFDSGLVDDVANGTGITDIPTTVAEAGGYPTL